MNNTQTYKYWFGYLVIFYLMISCSENPKIIPGTTLTLAEERKNAISNLQYDLSFDLPSSIKDSIPAVATLRFDLKNTSPILQLDFGASPKNIKKIIVNNHLLTVNCENEHILIDRKSLKDGANSVRIEFIAGETALNRNPDYLYTLFVPSRAASCFPSFDQPDLKAIYRLALSLPIDWYAVSNGKVNTLDTLENKKRYRFNATQPTSTYQFAFAAGKFRTATDPQSSMTMYYRETDSLKVARNVPKIFELHRQSLAWLKGYTKIDYPYEKFDFALMPAFQFGGMEHPGNIFYRESSLLLEPSASVNDELRRATLIAHETAHMWFGNLVTMKWFNDVWLKEVFANFMAAKIIYPSFPQVNHELRFLMAHYPSAYDIDRSEGSHPIQQPLDNLKNAGSVYGAIIYQKAPIMMRNLESLMGADSFQKGLQEYLAYFSYGNATWDDLVDALKKNTDQDLAAWNQSWIKTKGMPEIGYSLTDQKIQVRVVNATPDITWPQFFKFQISEKGKVTVRTIEMEKGAPALLEVSDTSGLIIIPNFKGRGYGYFLAGTSDRDAMLKFVNSLEDPEGRASVWMNLWEYLLRGTSDPETIFQHLLTAVKTEKDPLLMEYLTDKIGRIFWQFLTPAQRSQISKPLDDTLFELIALEKDKSLKRSLFNCYRNVALSPEGIANLSKFWKDEITLGLELSERDHIQLAYELSVREAAGAEEILASQLKKITNPDRKAEIEFVTKALSANPSLREAFFNSLKNKDNRTHEPWILEAVRYLHHPLRADDSKRFIMPSLELLEEVQRTGDIFFPKGWLDATLGELQSEEAAAMVREYLEKNKGLRTDLRNKLLQSADMLFRAEQALKKSKPAKKM